MLSTWSSKNSEGPYDPNKTRVGPINWAGDIDINTILGINPAIANNATSLEFDFIAQTNFLSFEYIFANYNNEHNFMFLDPPYDSEFTDYGYCQFGKKEQEKLAKYFKETKIKCLMVIGKTAFIQELYKDYIVDEYDKNYRFKLYDGRVGDEINTKHLVIKNY